MFQIGTHVADGWPIEHPDRTDPIAIIRERTDAELVVEALNQRDADPGELVVDKNVEALRGELDQVVKAMNETMGELTFARGDLELAQAVIAKLRHENERLAGELAAAQQLLEQAGAQGSDTPNPSHAG